MMDVASYVAGLSGQQGPPAPVGTTTGVLSVTAEIVGNTIAFNSGFFGMQVHLPSTLPTGGKTFYASACTIKRLRLSRNFTYVGCSDTPVVSGPLAVVGQNVTFPGIMSAVTIPSSSGGAICHKICPPGTFYYYTVTLYY